MPILVSGERASSGGVLPGGICLIDLAPELLVETIECVAVAFAIAPIFPVTAFPFDQADP